MGIEKQLYIIGAISLHLINAEDFRENRLKLYRETAPNVFNTSDEVTLCSIEGVSLLRCACLCSSWVSCNAAVWVQGNERQCFLYQDLHAHISNVGTTYILKKDAGNLYIYI